MMPDAAALLAAVAFAVFAAVTLVCCSGDCGDMDDGDYPCCTERGREFGAVISDRMMEGEWHE